MASRSASKSKKRAAKKRARVGAPPRPSPIPPHRPSSGFGSDPRRLFASALGVAMVVGALLVGLSQISVHRGKTAPAVSSGAGAGGIAQSSSLLGGIPQRGNLLGSPTAPVRLVEYADLQCPYCAVYARDVLPTLIRDYVRTGKVQLEYRGLAFLGPGSVSALRTATAAGAQNKMWNVLELLFGKQGPENAWVTDDLLRSTVTTAGADAARVFGARDGVAVTQAIEGWAREANTAGVTGTPTFFFGRRGATLDRLALTTLDVSQFRTALEGALQP